MSDLREAFCAIIDYLRAELPQPEVLDWGLRESAARGIPQIAITEIQGRFLSLLVRLIHAKRVVEIGTLGGYSAVWIARALSPDGKLISLELNPRHARMARDLLERAGLSSRVEIRLGPALKTLDELELDAPLDMVFIDADKPNNLGYFSWAEKHVRSGGLIIVDNVLMNGLVIRSTSAYMKSIEACNRYAFARYGDAVTVIPFYKKEEDHLDGMMIVQLP